MEVRQEAILVVPREEGTTKTRDEIEAMMAAAVGGGPETMLLTRTEVNRALEIKKAALKDESNLKPLTDFEYVQYAITTMEEPMEQILYRMEMMEKFKLEYKIEDTPQDGVELIHQLSLDQPGFLLSVAHLPSSNNFMSVIDWAHLFPHKCKTWNQNRTFLGYIYYILQCKTCQFTAIREGSSILVECMDAGIQNFDSQFFSQIPHQLTRWYPKVQREMFLLNSPSVVNICFALWRRIMRPDEKKAVHLGHKVMGMEGVRIDEFYNVPTPEAANQHLLESVFTLLQHRYKMEQQFKLPDKPLGEHTSLYLYNPNGSLS
jgi:CRAL/TRIO domain